MRKKRNILYHGAEIYFDKFYDLHFTLKKKTIKKHRKENLLVKSVNKMFEKFFFLNFVGL